MRRTIAIEGKEKIGGKVKESPEILLSIRNMSKANIPIKSAR